MGETRKFGIGIMMAIIGIVLLMTNIYLFLIAGIIFFFIKNIEPRKRHDYAQKYQKGHT